jgi:hypothetical protein
VQGGACAQHAPLSPRTLPPQNITLTPGSPGSISELNITRAPPPAALKAINATGALNATTNATMPPPPANATMPPPPANATMPPPPANATMPPAPANATMSPPPANATMPPPVGLPRPGAIESASTSSLNRTIASVAGANGTAAQAANLTTTRNAGAAVLPAALALPLALALALALLVSV